MLVCKSNKTVTKITKFTGSVYILNFKSRISAVIVLFAIVVTTLTSRSITDVNRGITVESVTYAVSNNVSTKSEEIVNPNSVIKYGTEEERLLNNQLLFPTTTGDEYLDSKIEEIFTQILTDDMSNYEKVMSIYIYLETNFYYYSSYSESANSYISEYDGKMVGRARGFFITGHGTCTEYSAAFMTMMRALGFECYCIQGSYNGSRHTWAVMILGENKYIFDPEIDFRLWQSSGHTENYDHFCLSTSNSECRKYYAYNEQDNIWSFNYFETK